MDTTDLENIDMATWLRMTDAQQLAIVNQYIGATSRKLVAGRAKERTMDIVKARRPSRRQLDEAHDSKPAFPAGQPDERWSDSELRGYIEHGDRQAAEQAAQRAPVLDVNRLTDEQQAAVARCVTREQYDQVISAIAAGNPPPMFEATPPDRSPIFTLKGSRK